MDPKHSLSQTRAHAMAECIFQIIVSEHHARRLTTWSVATSTTTNNTKNIVEFASIEFQFKMTNMHHFAHCI